MDPLVVVVAVLAVIVVANILLTTAVVRRLAAHERRLAALGPLMPTAGGLAPGAAVPTFAAETVDGHRIDTDVLGGSPTLVAFFSTTCDACIDHAPEFAEVAAGTSAFAVISGPGAEDLLRILEPVPVVHEPESGGELVRAFEVDTFPTYYAIEAGHVVAPVGSAAEARELLTPARGS